MRLSTTGFQMGSPRWTGRRTGNMLPTHTVRTHTDQARMDPIRQGAIRKLRVARLGSSVRQMPSSAKGTAKNEVKLSAPDIDWDYAVVERLNPDTLKTSLLPFDLGKLVLQHDVSQDLALEPGDTVTIFSEARYPRPAGSTNQVRDAGRGVCTCRRLQRCSRGDATGLGATRGRFNEQRVSLRVLNLIANPRGFCSSNASTSM